MIIILLKSGMRQEELLALRCGDVNLENNTINICRALDIDTTNPTKVPKSASSIRSVPMHSEVYKQLQEIGIQKEGYIFHTNSGNLYRPDNFRRDYQKYLDAAGVKYRSPHITRLPLQVIFALPELI
jgi:Site-specific recombinase XerD